MPNHHKPSMPIYIAVLLISFLWQLGLWGVTESSEARYAEISREMLLSGNMLLPQYLGVLHFDKPLMTYWITALGYEIFGFNAFGARFFLQIAFSVQLVLVYQIAKVLFDNRKIAMYSLICYAAIPLSLISVRNLTTDAYLNTFSLIAVFLYILFRKNNKLTALYGFFIALGLAIFTKGPFALILPLCALFPINQIIKNQIYQKRILFHFTVGIIIMLIVGSWWFFYLMSSSLEFYNFFIGEQIVNRLAHADKLNRSKPFWYYISLLPLFIFPVFGLVINWLKNVKYTAKNVNLLGLFTILIPLVLFSLASSKLILYILPITPFIAICTGFQLNQVANNGLKKIFVANSILYGFLILSVIVISCGFIKEIPVNMDTQLLLFIVLLTGYFIYTIVSTFEIKWKFLFQLLIIPLIIVPLSTNILNQIELKINGTKPISVFIHQNFPNHKVLVWNRVLNSMAFNLQKPIYSIKYRHYSLDRKTQFQPDDQWKLNLIDVNNKDELVYLKNLISDKVVLIRNKKDEIPQEMEWITQAFRSKKHFGKYIVYYK
jgi:4-amino-4-deoxy-L-arabinose transferase-like glycosyltransferase